MAIKILNGFKVQICYLRLKGIKGSLIESTEPLVLPSESGSNRVPDPHPDDPPPKKGPRMILVREVGPNNKKLMHNQVALLPPEELEEQRAEPHGPCVPIKKFAYIDGLFAHPGDPNDSRMVFADPLWILRVDNPESKTVHEQTVTVVNKNKQQFVVDPRQVCWVPSTKFLEDYYTLAGGHVRTEMGKLKECTVVQKDRPKDTHVRLFGKDHKIELLDERQIQAYVLKRLEESNRPLPGTWPAATWNTQGISSITTKPASSFVTPPKPKGSPETACNLGRKCPRLKEVETPDGKKILISVGVSFEQLPTHDNPYPKHHHLLDSECPIVQNGDSHYPHCAYDLEQGRRCIMTSLNIAHSCCSLGLPPGTEFREEAYVNKTQELPGRPANLQINAEPRQFKDRDAQDAAKAFQYGIIDMKKREAELQAEKARLEPYLLSQTNRQEHGLLAGVAVPASANPGPALQAATVGDFGFPLQQPPSQPSLQFDGFILDGSVTYQSPYQPTPQPDPLVQGNDGLFHEHIASGPFMPSNSSVMWMPDPNVADGLPTMPMQTDDPYTSSP